MADILGGAVESLTGGRVQGWTSDLGVGENTFDSGCIDLSFCICFARALLAALFADEGIGGVQGVEYGGKGA